MTIGTLKFEGRIDTARAGEIELALAAKAGALDQRGDRAIIDLKEVIYLSSMGIRLLTTTIKQFTQRGVSFVTIPPDDGLVNETLKIASLTDHLNMVEDREAALAVVNQG